MGLGVDEPVWDHSTFSKNRDRLLDGDIAARFLSAILVQPRVRRLLSSDHFSVDGTLVEAWASMKSFRPRDELGRAATMMAGATRPSTSGQESVPTPRTPAPSILTPCSITSLS